MNELVCKKCKKIISDENDRLKFKNNIYCPLCYVKVVKGGPSGKAIVFWILGIIILVLIIFLWIVSFLVSTAYYSSFS